MSPSEYEIIQVSADTWRIEDGGVRFFLLAGTDRALLIDSGMNVHNARDIAATLTSLPLELLNTHADMDHTGSNAQFDAVYMHPAEKINYRGGNPERIVPVAEGDVLDLGGRLLEIIHIPGHTPGSIAILDRRDRRLISGDPIQDGRIFMFGPARNMDDYVRSLEHLAAWEGRFDEIWPSHGSLPVSPALIGKLHDAAQRILSGDAEGHAEEMFGRKILVYDFGFAAFLCNS